MECLGHVWGANGRFFIEIRDRASNTERAMITACRQRTLLGGTNKETVAVIRQSSASVEPATGRAGVAFDVGERCVTFALTETRGVDTPPYLS